MNKILINASVLFRIKIEIFKLLLFYDFEN